MVTESERQLAGGGGSICFLSGFLTSSLLSSGLWWYSEWPIVIVPQSRRQSQIIFLWVGGFSFALARRFVSLFRRLWQWGDGVVIA